MAIPSREIGWSTQSNLLWEISKELERLTCVLAGGCTTTTTTTSQYTPWLFIPNEISVFPESSDGYTLYTEGFTNNDDGQSNSPFPFAGEFYTSNGISDNQTFLSTNGYIIPFNSGFQLSGNQQDLYLTPGDSLNDGDIQNFWYQNYVGVSRWRTRILVYCGHYGNEQVPYSYVLNIYRDLNYQYMEACNKVNNVIAGDAGPTGSFESSSSATQVWRSDLAGTTWTYLGFGSIE